MTSSKSNSWCRRATLAVIVGVSVLIGLADVASAGRKRLVVLDFEGDNAEKLQADLVKLLKKTHTVVATDKWTSAADELSASKVTDKNVKKVAKKLKIDGVLPGTVEKRRDEYILRIKLRSGASGELVGSQVNVKARGTKLDSSAQQDLKDELFESIETLEANRGGGGGGDEEEEVVEEKPAKKGFGKKAEPEVVEEKPAKKGFGKKAEPAIEEEKPVKVVEAKPAKKVVKAAEEEDPLPKKKQVAARDDDEEESVEEEAEPRGSSNTTLNHSPGRRAIDFTAGLSFTMRRMAFTYDPNRTSKPPGYKGTPVAGAVVDLAVYPLSLAHNSTSVLTNIGVTAFYDKVLVINSKDPMGNELKSSQARYAFGAIYRHPLGKGATAPVVGGGIRYGQQSFTIDGNAGIPNVSYTIIDPHVFFKLPLSTKLVVNADFGYMLITNTGNIQRADQYGAAKVAGVEGELTADYMLTGNIFARAGVRFHTVGFQFKGTGAKAMEGAVGGARDTYIGAAVTGGYVF